MTGSPSTRWSRARATRPTAGATYNAPRGPPGPRRARRGRVRRVPPWLIIRSLSRPLGGDPSAMLKDISPGEGDLTRRLGVRTQDERGPRWPRRSTSSWTSSTTSSARCETAQATWRARRAAAHGGRRAALVGLAGAGLEPGGDGRVPGGDHRHRQAERRQRPAGQPARGGLARRRRRRAARS